MSRRWSGLNGLLRLRRRGRRASPPGCAEAEGSAPTGGGSWQRGHFGIGDGDRWDEAVKALDGGVLQSWAWGEWYREGGFLVERVCVDGPEGTGLAQVLIWPHTRPAEAHVPWGPVLQGDGQAVLRELFAALDETCGRHRPLTLVVEPPAPLRLPDLGSEHVFTQATERWCCPGRTAVVPLLDDGALLAGMHHQTRRNVRLGQRRGVVVERASPNATSLATFYELLHATEQRNQFTAESLSYYESFLRALEAEAVLLFARTEAGVAAGAIMTCFGKEAIYHFGASSTELRVPGVTAYLQYEAMRLARGRGCTRYDLWGVPEEDPVPEEGGNPVRSSGGDWRGLRHFKAGFGAELVAHPPPLVRHYPATRGWPFAKRR